jgi:hypothetical protein
MRPMGLKEEAVMAISLANAEAAVKALTACKAGEMFDKIKGNQHTMEKHFSKQTAEAAALQDGEPQGYFKRVATKTVTSQNINTVSEQTRAKAFTMVGANKAAEFGRKLRARELSVPEKSAASKDDILGIVSSVFSSGAFTLRENNKEPQTRFILVSPMPRGFYGRAIDQHGVKAKDCNHAVIVINASSTLNPQIVTVFPSGDDYVNRRPLLT